VIVTGRITWIDTGAAEAVPGVLAVLTHHNAPRLADTQDAELAILQSDRIAFRGQMIGGVIAISLEIARYAASLVQVSYDAQSHDADLRADRDDLYAPQNVNGGYDTDTAQGDVDAALASAAVTVDQVYTTAMYHNNPMEPHATVAVWSDDELTLFESTQGVHVVRDAVAPLFGIAPEQVHVVSPYVGGGFGSKGAAHAQLVLAAMAARLVQGRPVKLALTRQQMFVLAGYRTPTIQRVRLGAAADGRLSALSMDAVSQTSRIKEFAEQTALPARMMYAAPHRRTTHRVAKLDVPVPSWMRRWVSGRACSARRSRWMSWPSPAGSTPLSCASATSPTSTPSPAGLSPAVTSWPACAKGRDGSAGSGVRRRHGYDVMPTGWSGSECPRRPFRLSACRGRPRRSGPPRTAATRCRSAPPTSAPEPGPR
jgi:xanthine dehydrogenase YagR molybdenum-binding subunit